MTEATTHANTNQGTAADRNQDTMNVDQGEIDKFDKIAARWWDKQGEFKPLHDINPIRLQYIQEKISLADKNVIDVGCGGGILTESMAGCGAHVTGIDMAESPLSVARLHQFESGLEIDYRLTSAEQLAEQSPGSYDIVTCMELLEHVPDPASLIKACAQLVKPDGHLFFSTINRNPKAYLLAILGAEYFLKMLPKGTHDYDRFIKPSELGAWARQARLTINELKGITYNPLTKKFTLGEDVSVNYLVHTRPG